MYDPVMKGRLFLLGGRIRSTMLGIPESYRLSLRSAGPSKLDDSCVLLERPQRSIDTCYPFSPVAIISRALMKPTSRHNKIPNYAKEQTCCRLDRGRCG